MLALIEKRFMSNPAKEGEDADIPHLTARDANADTLEDMFGFDVAPSKNTVIDPSLASAPAKSREPVTVVLLCCPAPAIIRPALK
jgi:hypothetical protein